MSVVASPAIPGESVGPRRDLVVGVGVTVAVVAAFVLAPVSGSSLGAVRLESAGRVLVAGIPVFVGIYAWRGVPFARLGMLLVVSGVIWLVVTFSLNDRALAYSIGRVADWVGWASLLCLMLAFPDGRLVGRVDRSLAAMVGLVVAVLWLPTALLVDRYPTPADWETCSSGCPHNAFMLVAHQPGLIAQVVVPLREGLTLFLFLAIVARLVGRIASASRVRRRTVTPVLVVAAAGTALTALALVVRKVAPGSSLLAILWWLSAFALPAMALAFLVGLMRWRLYVGASLGRFAAALGSPSGPEGMRVALAEAFEDPSLAVVYPVADGRWVTVEGRPTDFPVTGRGRSVTEVRHRGQTVAALIHDEALQSERAFVDAVGSYATLSLENHRLAAELASVVREVRETQARAAASADHAREEIERDLHDGAQQRLIALRIKLQLAAERSPDSEEQLNNLGAEVQRVMDELRALAHGVFTARPHRPRSGRGAPRSRPRRPDPHHRDSSRPKTLHSRDREGSLLLLSRGLAECIQARRHSYRSARHHH